MGAAGPAAQCPPPEPIPHLVTGASALPDGRSKPFASMKGRAMSLDALKNRLPDHAKDIKLNLSSLARETVLDANAYDRHDRQAGTGTLGPEFRRR